MKCWLVRILVLLVLGAIVNVVVAWGCAAIVNPITDEPLSVVERNSNGTVRMEAIRHPPFGTRFVLTSHNGTRLAPDGSVFEIIETRGWPTLSMSLNRDDELQPISGAVMLPFRPFALTLKPAGLVRALPIVPLWPGFAINTVFYALVLWLLFAFGGTPFALRRRRRIKRGLCPKCAYDLRGTPASICPECGAVK